MIAFPNYDSAQDLRVFLEERSMAMQKKFGQNFLINKSAREKLIDFLDVDENIHVWEVGPGLGAMTTEILSRGASVTAFEIDRGFAEVLIQMLTSDNLSLKDGNKKWGKFNLIQGDVLKTWKPELQLKGLPNRFFGNLPYNIAATIIADTIEQGIRFDKAVVTVQKEVAQRMVAKPGSKDYSSFSVLCQFAYDIKSIMDLSGNSFWPRPNVDSRAVLMLPKKDFPNCKNINHFMKLQRALFASRRKTVKNNLALFYSNADKAGDILSKAGINPSSRAEVLTIDQLLQLSDVSFDSIEK